MKAPKSQVQAVAEIVSFSEFTAENPVEIPEISIGIEAGERPRLLCDGRTARLFTQPRGAGPYEELIRRTREFWEASENGEPPVDPPAPGYLSAAAYLTVNKEYLALAITEIDKALVPEGGFVTDEALEAFTWAAIGIDAIGLQISDLDKELIYETARDTLDTKLLPALKRELMVVDGDTIIESEDFFRRDGYIARVYAAAFLWELILTDSPEQWKELALQAYPVLVALQDGPIDGYQGDSHELVGGPIDDGLYLAIIAWERMAGVELIDPEFLRVTIDDALEYCIHGTEKDGLECLSLAEGKAAVMHLVRWRGMLEEEESAELDSWIGVEDYSSEALMYLFFRPWGKRG